MTVKELMSTLTIGGDVVFVDNETLEDITEPEYLPMLRFNEELMNKEVVKINAHVNRPFLQKYLGLCDSLYSTRACYTEIYVK